VRIGERGSLRLRLPRVPGPTLEAAVLNTGGGIACGDRFSISVDAAADARLVVATPAAEKAYRSDGPMAHVSVRLTLAAGAEIAWLPQETILFDRARLQRRIDVEMDESARMLLFEAVVFGRTARGEEVSEGFFEERWRIRRGGRLVHADTFRLSGPIGPLLDRPAVAGGARALATFIYAAPDAERKLDQARAILGDASCTAGASAWKGLLAVRFLARDGAELRRAAARFIEGFRGCPAPRVWQS
jgi:urease accessory protein